VCPNTAVIPKDDEEMLETWGKDITSPVNNSQLSHQKLLETIQGFITELNQAKRELRH
jgi:hypothetical protein